MAFLYGRPGAPTAGELAAHCSAGALLDAANATPTVRATRTVRVSADGAATFARTKLRSKVVRGDHIKIGGSCHEASFAIDDTHLVLREDVGPHVVAAAPL